MSRTISLPQEPWFDPETGNPTVQFRMAFEELLNGTSTNSIGTVISGVNAVKQSQVDEAAADAENAEEPASAITISANPTKAVGSGSGSGTTSTNNVTISIGGGTAPYALSWVNESGYAFTVSGPSSLATDGDAVFGFSAPSGDRSGRQKLTATDSAGTPVTASITIPTTTFDTSGVNA